VVRCANIRDGVCFAVDEDSSVGGALAPGKIIDADDPERRPTGISERQTLQVAENSIAAQWDPEMPEQPSSGFTTGTVPQHQHDPGGGRGPAGMRRGQGVGTIRIDTACGGDRFVITDARALGFTLQPDEAGDIAEMGIRITKVANEQLGFRHPVNAARDHISFLPDRGAAAAERRRLDRSERRPGISGVAGRAWRHRNEHQTRSSTRWPRRHWHSPCRRPPTPLPASKRVLFSALKGLAIWMAAKVGLTRPGHAHNSGKSSLRNSPSFRSLVRARSISRWRSSTRRIFPEIVFGSSPNSIRRTRL
jgi:hypothetical protein